MQAKDRDPKEPQAKHTANDLNAAGRGQGPSHASVPGRYLSSAKKNVHVQYSVSCIFALSFVAPSADMGFRNHKVPFRLTFHDYVTRKGIRNTRENG